jgi:hypothetical protein
MNSTCTAPPQQRERRHQFVPGDALSCEVPWPGTEFAQGRDASGEEGTRRRVRTLIELEILADRLRADALPHEHIVPADGFKNRIGGE